MKLIHVYININMISAFILSLYGQNKTIIDGQKMIFIYLRLSISHYNIIHILRVNDLFQQKQTLIKQLFGTSAD